MTNKNPQQASGEEATAVPLDMTPLTSLVGFNLGAAYVLARRVFMNHMEVFQVRPIEYSILALLRNSNVNQSQLSGVLNITQPNLAVVIARLAKRGLLKRELSQIDRRARHIRLTVTGERLLAQCEAQLGQVEGDLMGSLSAGERAIFAELLHKMVYKTSVVSKTPIG